MPARRSVLWVVRCPVTEYAAAFEAQRAIRDARLAGEVPDVLLLLEHEPVFTKGRRTERADLPMGEQWYRRQGIDVVDSDRGGRVTYHGPGQLVGYPIVSLRAYGDSIPAYVSTMERTIGQSLGAWGIEARAFPGLTGVWTDGPGGPGRKIASIGIHVHRGITTHGFAINVNNDLQPFEWVVPCGLESCRMTSVCRELGREVDLDEVADVVGERWTAMFGRRAVDVAPAELVERVPGAAALVPAGVPA